MDPMGQVLLMNRPPQAAGPLDGLSNVTGAWSASRNLLSAFFGTLYTTATGVNLWTNQKLVNADLVQSVAGRQPAVTTAGPNSRTCFDFVANSLVTPGGAGGTLDAYINASDGYVVMSVIVDAIDSNNVTVYANDCIMGDNGGYMGLFLKNSPGNLLFGYNWDGNSDSNSLAITLGTPHVIEWIHEGGVLSVRIDGGTPATVASGNTQSLAAIFCVGSASAVPAATNSLDGKIFECVTFDAVPSSTVRDTLVADMLAWM